MRVSAWNIIALRDTVFVVWRLFLSNEGALVAQINDIHFLKRRIFTKTLTEVTCACWMWGYRTVNARYKMWMLRNLNVYPSNKFQGRLSDQNFHLLPIHRCLYKQETMNKIIMKERKMSSTNTSFGKPIEIFVVTFYEIFGYFWNEYTVLRNATINIISKSNKIPLRTISRT